MNKVYVNKETNMVEQIINIDVDTRWDPYWFPWCYIVDDPENKVDSYNLRYNTETGEFEVNEDFIPVETKIEDSEQQKEMKQLKEELEMTQNALNEILMMTLGGM